MFIQYTLFCQVTYHKRTAIDFEGTVHFSKRAVSTFHSQMSFKLSVEERVRRKEGGRDEEKMRGKEDGEGSVCAWP